MKLLSLRKLMGFKSLPALKNLVAFKNLPALTAIGLLSFCVIQADAKNEAFENAKALVWRDLQPRIITLQRDVYTYHHFEWQTKGHVSRVRPLKDPFFQNYFRGELGQFWSNDPRGGGNAGPGLYAAADPQSSFSYGESILEIKFKKGSRILDLAESVSLEYDTQQAIAALYPSELEDRVRTTWLVFSKQNEAKNLHYFRDLLKQIFYEQKIYIVAYSYGTYLGPNFCTLFSRAGLKNASAFSTYDSFASYNSSSLKENEFQEQKNYMNSLQLKYTRRPVAFLLLGQTSSGHGGGNGVVQIPSELSASVITDQPGELSGEKKAVYERITKVITAVASYKNSDTKNLAKSLSPEETTSLRANLFGCDERYTEDMNIRPNETPSTPVK